MSKPRAAIFSSWLAAAASLGLLIPAAGRAQESTSVAGPLEPSHAAVAVAAGPAGALSQALAAACSESQTEFAKFLTRRNQESFTRMTAASRIAFMKRFVLLSQPGKPSITLNPSGRPVVRCETPDGAAEIQIGGADQQDNLAFMPVELRDATDLAGSDVVRVNMGLVREENQWRVLSLGLVLLDLPSLEVEWNSAEASANETEAFETLKMVAEAIETYRKTYLRLPDSLAKLGPPEPPATGAVAADDAKGAKIAAKAAAKVKAGPDAADLLDADLAAGKKDGYAYRYVILGASNLGAVAQFELAASPAPYGSAGKRSFFRDASGAIHAGDHKGAVGSATDPKVE
jgi:hypothetical protein